MSATDELRRMLDERGMEWVDTGDGSTLIPEQAATNVAWDVNVWPSGKDMGDCLWVQNRHPLTPEQAIFATLGGTCETCPQMDNPDSFIRHLIGRETCELEELARDMYKAIVAMIAIPGYADAHRSELEAIDDRAHSLGVEP